MKSQTLRTIGYPTLFIAACTMLYAFYLVIFPLKTAYAVRQPFQVITKRVPLGGTFKYYVALCKYNNSQGIISRQLIGPEFRFLSSEPSNIPIGCNTAIRSVSIPSDITPGKYTVSITTVYRNNALHSTTNRFQTEAFEIFDPRAIATSTTPTSIVSSSITPITSMPRLPNVSIQ